MFDFNSLSAKEQILVRMIKEFPDMDLDQAEKLYDSAEKGGEFKACGSVDDWFENRFKFGTVILDNNDYITALTHSIRIALRVAPTDYGTTRQRDFGQTWMDTARGFLGEIAIGKLLKNRFNVEIVPDYSIGKLELYLPSDIKKIKTKSGVEDPGILFSFKTTKFNGIWLDVPGAQFSHSDAFALIKIGIAREHFAAFLKKISFIKDKLIPSAIEIGTIDKKQSEALWGSLPELKKILGYVAGFLYKEVGDTAQAMEYRERRTRSGEFKAYLMLRYCGRIEERKPAGVPDELKSKPWQYQSIESFSSQDRFISTPGYMLYSEKDWRELVKKLTAKKNK